MRVETFRSGGKGGLNVNKVETGVRAVHVPTGLAVVSTQARSQHMNKRLDLDRLEHTRLERGGAVRTYVGTDFRRVE